MNAMNFFNASRWLKMPAAALLVCLGLITTMSTGCGSGDQSDAMFAEANDQNIKRIATLYSVYQGKNNYKGPKDEAELKAFIQQQNTKHLARIGVDVAKLDEYFISERDGQPFKIRWGLTVRPRSAPIPLVFESEGVNGKYLVSFSSYITKEVEQAEYDQLWNGKMDDSPANENRGGQTGRPPR